MTKNTAALRLLPALFFGLTCLSFFLDEGMFWPFLIISALLSISFLTLYQKSLGGREEWSTAGSIAIGISGVSLLFAARMISFASAGILAASATALFAAVVVFLLLYLVERKRITGSSELSVGAPVVRGSWG